MLNARLLKARIGQYSALWMGCFAIVLLAAAGATLGLRMDFVAVSDLVLATALAVLGLLLIAFLGVTLTSRQTTSTKAALLILGALLALPLLWSPVLAVVVAAYLDRAEVEYSAVYAGFRVVVSHIVYPLAETLFSGALIETVWSAFEAAATVIGFAASLITLWPWLRGAIWGKSLVQQS